MLYSSTASIFLVSQGQPSMSYSTVICCTCIIRFCKTPFVGIIVTLTEFRKDTPYPRRVDACDGLIFAQLASSAAVDYKRSGDRHRGVL